MGRHAAVARPRPAWIVELVTMIALVTLMLDLRRPPGRRRATRDNPATATPYRAAHAAPSRRPSPHPRPLTSSATGQ